MVRSKNSAPLKKKTTAKFSVFKKPYTEMKTKPLSPNAVPGSDLLEKWPFKKPAKDDDAAVFNQYFLSQQQRALIIYQCNKCNSKALKYDKQKLIEGTLTLCLPLCPSCVLANRRANQSVFFNIALKNIHDRVKEAAVQDASAKKTGAKKRRDEAIDSDENESEMSESEDKENLPPYEEEEEEEED